MWSHDHKQNHAKTSKQKQVKRTEVQLTYMEKECLINSEEIVAQALAEFLFQEKKEVNC